MTNGDHLSSLFASCTLAYKREESSEHSDSVLRMNLTMLILKHPCYSLTSTCPSATLPIPHTLGMPFNIWLVRYNTEEELLTILIENYSTLTAQSG